MLGKLLTVLGCSLWSVPSVDQSTRRPLSGSRRRRAVRSLGAFLAYFAIVVFIGSVIYFVVVGEPFAIGGSAESLISQQSDKTVEGTLREPGAKATPFGETAATVDGSKERVAVCVSFREASDPVRVVYEPNPADCSKSRSCSYLDIGELQDTLQA